MRLIRSGDSYYKDRYNVYAKKNDHVNIDFSWFGKGFHRNSSFSVDISLDDLIRLVWEMAHVGSERAQWVNLALRLHPEFQKTLAALDEEAANEEREYLEREERSARETEGDSDGSD